MADLPWLTHDDFAHRVGEVFEVTQPAAGAQDLILAETAEGDVPGGAGPDGEVRRQFSLVLTGPLATALPQGTVVLRHEGLGELALFLVPLGPSGGLMRYHAAFA